MPGSPRTHAVAREALRFVENELPSEWPAERSLEDYGYDLFVSIHTATEATALEFRIQVKGRKHYRTTRSATIVERLRVATLNLFDQAHVPVMLAVYSVEENCAYYVWVKSYIHNVLDKKNSNWRSRDRDSRISIHIPRQNRLSRDQASRIWDEVEAQYGDIALRGLHTAHERHAQPKDLLVESTRLYPTHINPHVSRPRLVEALKEEIADHCVFLCCPAGYGKTGVVHDYITVVQPNIAVWFTFDGSPISVVQVLKEIASEFLRQTGCVGRATLIYINRKGGSLRASELVAVFVRELSEACDTMLLVLEDIYEARHTEIYHMIDNLIRIRPDNLRILLTSREALPEGEARLIAQKRLKIFDTTEVQFSEREIREFLREFEITLDNGQLADLHRHTEGWIAPVALAVSALDSDSRNDAKELFRRLEDFDGNIYAFFAQEVYLRLDPDLRWLLRRICLTRTVHSETISAVCGRTDGGQLLRDLSQANTFLTSLEKGKGTYRFHSMFAEFLKKRLLDEEGSATLREVELSLARYYEKDHNWLPAVEHFIKSTEFSSAVRCLERIAPLTLKLGYGYALVSFFDEIPDKWRRESVLLHDFVGQAALQIGNPRKALPPLKRAHELYNGIYGVQSGESTSLPDCGGSIRNRRT